MKVRKTEWSYERIRIHDLKFYFEFPRIIPLRQRLRERLVAQLVYLAPVFNDGFYFET